MVNCTNVELADTYAGYGIADCTKQAARQRLYVKQFSMSVFSVIIFCKGTPELLGILRETELDPYHVQRVLALQTGALFDEVALEILSDEPDNQAGSGRKPRVPGWENERYLRKKTPTPLSRATQNSYISSNGEKNAWPGTIGMTGHKTPGRNRRRA
ncbi:hypothetical protein NPIL_253141 [Nephila pilipes]|uniref:Uncharacterized protein n=1 Tax=Nephila pilipes TaxID=299642 RepID=A0A8X6N301_NEPPI|nr:hypothetical protein NPIL_253141 [Nephila pilipes]